MSDSALSITVLGSGTSAGVPMIGCHCPVCSSDDPRDQRSRPSIVVSYDQDGQRHNILVDTAPELRLQAIRHGIDRISALVFTHAHADHIFGLDDVRRYNTVMGSRLSIHGTSEVLERIAQTFPYAFDAPRRACAQYPDAIYRPELDPVVIDGPFHLLGRQWLPVVLPHGRGSVLGFRIGDFAYCTDCHDIPAESRTHLRGLDTLIIDALRPRPHPAHMSFEQALAVISDLEPRRAYFTHLSHDMTHADIEKTLPPQVRVAYDGLRLDVP